MHDLVYIQTSEMREQYQKYPEILFVDTTYNVNIEAYPLLAMMVEDGDGRGKPVAYCFQRSETKENLEKILDYFCKTNDTSKTKIVMVDKDLTEISVLRSKLPNADILLCKFHVMKYLKKKISDLNCLKDEKQELGILVQKLINSQNEEEYEKYHSELQNFDAEFVTYFDKNWHSCKKLWVMYFRSSLRTHGNNTNNKLESHNQKLKKYLNSNMRLPEAVEQLSNFIDDTYAKSSFNRYENLKTKIDRRNNDEDLVKYSLLCNSKSFQIVNDEFRQGTNTDFSITESDEAYTVKSLSSEYTVSKKLDECTCLCFSNFGLPCRHIFVCRREKTVSVFDESLIPKRWVKEFEKPDNNEQPVGQASVTVAKRKDKRTKPKSVIEKYNKASEICRDIATCFVNLWPNRI